jgi:hypothetical protein
VLLALVLSGLTGCEGPAPAKIAPGKEAKTAASKTAARRKAGPARESPRAQHAPTAAQPAALPPVPEQRPAAFAPAEQAAPTAEDVLPAPNPPPPVDAGKIAAAGIRTLSGKHVTLYTDLPAGEVDELPAVFDAAVPLWCEYFHIDLARVAEWRPAACVMKDKERFAGAALFDDSLPPFPHGYSRGSQLWLFDQPSAYYRRHLLLHEGTHCFMNELLRGAGPPWYMEGIAELLATHHWQAGKLQLAIMPQSKDEVPYWGRVKIIRDEFAAGRGMSLAQILSYDRHAHLRNEPYVWCWGAAAFFDAHPKTQTAFRELRKDAADTSKAFSLRFAERLKADWPHIDQDWQLFVLNCDYGYDFARAAVVHRPASDLPAGGATATIAADRGWQSTGFRLAAGKTYTLTASGRYQVANNPKPWPCELQGVTIRYHAGRPLGMLLAAVKPDEGTGTTPLAAPQPIGRSGLVMPASTGTLYLSINEAASGLADNTGTLEVQVREN